MFIVFSEKWNCLSNRWLWLFRKWFDKWGNAITHQMHGPLLGLRGRREWTPHLGFRSLLFIGVETTFRSMRSEPARCYCLCQLFGWGGLSSHRFQNVCIVGPSCSPGPPMGENSWGQETAPISGHSFWRGLFWKLVRRQLPKASQTLTKGNATSEKHLFRLKFNSLVSTMKKQMNTHCATQPQIRFLRALQLWLCLH